MFQDLGGRVLVGGQKLVVRLKLHGRQVEGVVIFKKRQGKLN